MFMNIGSLDGKNKAEFVRLIHENDLLQIEKKNEHYASQDNKGRRCVTFDPANQSMLLIFLSLMLVKIRDPIHWKR